jgi:hypothetical protein
MSATVRRVQYFYATVRGEPDEAYGLLTHLAEQGINLLAMHMVPAGPESTQLTLFPEYSAKFQSAARDMGLALEGPHSAILVQQEDAIGALAGLHDRLSKAAVQAYASTAIVDGRGYFGYVLYVRETDADRAMAALHA